MSPDHSIDSLRASMEEALARYDKPAAVTAALAAVDDGTVSIPALYDLLASVMVDMGSRWQTGGIRVWEEHIASGIVRTIVEALYPTVQRLAAAAAPDGRTVLLSCPPDEAHDLGLRMLADRFALSGSTVHMLGPDTPGAEIAAAARALHPDLIVLTSSTHFHRVRVRSLLDFLRRELPGVRVVVGGPAFAADTGGFSDDEIMSNADIVRGDRKAGE